MASNRRPGSDGYPDLATIIAGCVAGTVFVAIVMGLAGVIG
jgi:hypothetical protein